MSRQQTQPLICEERILINSISRIPSLDWVQVGFNTAQRARAGRRYVTDAKTLSMHGLTLKPDCPLKIWSGWPSR